ncbi:GNAT family N-acetyltransferase [Pelomonas sp. KK5]|uniref:GNAT family N-acetyltransferase n=1 Tax=Pelomonas sp. KK5 TaxID=1855730 RepID=UPI00097C3595|nr:GNAT family N-acetyltransferase [Pelomonas sp. KK5]
MKPPLERLRRRLQQRRKLRSPTGLRFAIADRLEQLNPLQWDALAEGQSWFFSRDYLAMLEQVPPDCLQPRYGLICDDEGPIAAVVMQWVALEAERMRPVAGRRIGLQALVDGLGERALVCGNLLSYGMHAVAMAPDVEPESVWPAVAELLYRVRRAEKLAGRSGFVIVKDVIEPRGVDVLAGLSYRGVETEPNMVLALDPAWASHEHYLGSLASKYRSSVRKQIMEPLRDAGLTLHAFEPGEDAALHARMHELYLQVHENASFRPFTLHAGYFGALARSAGPACIRHAGVFDRDSRLLGFIVTLLDGEQAIAYHIGFDRAASAALPLYLGLLHASIGDAIALRAREVSLGRTALEPKARLGARPQPMQVWMRHRQPLLNQLTLRLLGLVPHEDAPDRNPFKTQ